MATTKKVLTKKKIIKKITKKSNETDFKKTL